MLHSFPESIPNPAPCPDAPKRFWPFLRPHFRLLLIAAAGNFFTVFVVMLLPLVAKLIIDEAIPGRNVHLLVGIAVGLFVLQAARFVVGYCHDFLINYIGQQTVFDIRRALFSHLQLLHLAFYEQRKTGSLVNRVIHDATAIQQFINTAFASIANSLVSLLIALTIMFILAPDLTFFCAATLPIYFAVIHAFRKKLRAKNHEVRERQSVLAGKLGETFAGIRVVKSFGQEDQECRRFLHTIRENFPSELELPMISTSMRSVLGLMFMLIYAIAIVCLGLGAIGGHMSVGGYVAYTSYLWMLFGPIDNLAVLIQSSTNARAGFERILALLDTKPVITQPANPIVLNRMVGNVRFDHVAFSYTDTPTIHDFCLDVSAGEVIALVGPSGSGKSTLMSLLTRFYDINSGRILIDGIDLRSLDYDSYRQRVGIVLQDNFLFSGSVEDNIRYGRPGAGEEEIRRAALLANALDFIERMPDGFASQVGQGGVFLSGGQRQRIAIARCILKNPRILILDEATSALDSESEALIQCSMDTLMKGRTVFIVAHRLRTIRNADRIVVIDQGKAAEIGTHDELMARGGLYAHLYRAPEDEPSELSSPISEVA